MTNPPTDHEIYMIGWLCGMVVGVLIGVMLQSVIGLV
jgi:hypothetical protein